MTDDWMLVKVLLPSSIVFLWLCWELVKTRRALERSDGSEDDDAES